VMLMALLRGDGTRSIQDIAKVILGHDQSQIEYYEKITRDMVGRVLRNRGIVTKDGRSFSLNGYESLTEEQIAVLIKLCQQKLDDYLAKRGDSVFQHRKQSAGYVSGTLRYEVLKRSEFHCELCGVSADVKALEVDHILPRNHGGSDDLSNLQALCYSCNAMKRDRDDTDFREIRESYGRREGGCLFCEMAHDRIVDENELSYVIWDGFPVTSLHALVIPKRHVATYFDLGQAEINACNDLLRKTGELIMKKDSAVTGFNIGINNGEDSGQTIFHCHIHLIPRRKGDVENPKGGVRHLIPGKGFY